MSTPQISRPPRRVNLARVFSPGIILVSIFATLTGCDRQSTDRAQGYVEGEYIYVASPLPGQLDALSVERGADVNPGTALFTLNSTPETAARDQAARQLDQARANLEDAKKGKRPSEIESMHAQLDQARAASTFADNEFIRVQGLIKTGGASQQQFDQDQSNRDQNRARVTQMEADIKTAELGQRVDALTAAEQEVQAKQAALDQAQWNLSQKHQDAPRAGLVFDTMYLPGEWVDAGHPVVAILPPENIKVRAFVSEDRVGALHPGDSVRVYVDGVADSFVGKVSFISPKAEYTPPVIYSRESRDKLVFMIEIIFDGQTAAKLHPGQPVDVMLNGASR